MKNVESVEVQPFHQLGAFKWKAMKLDYKHANTAAAAPDLVNRVIEQFRAGAAALGDAFVQEIAFAQGGYRDAWLCLLDDLSQGCGVGSSAVAQRDRTLWLRLRPDL